MLCIFIVLERERNDMGKNVLTLYMSLVLLKGRLAGARLELMDLQKEFLTVRDTNNLNKINKILDFLNEANDIIGNND